MRYFHKIYCRGSQISQQLLLTSLIFKKSIMLNKSNFQKKNFKVSYLRHLVILSASLFASFLCKATNYYFSSSSGNDSYSSAQAQSQATPWKSVSKLNSIFSSLVAGDFIYLKRGDTFFGTIIISKSGNSSSPITITAYGAGDKPVVTGLASITGWINEGNGIYSKIISSAAQTNMVLINGVQYAMGRYPDVAYLKYQTFSGNSSITDNTLGTSINWTGAEAAIKKNNWTIDRCLIKSHSGNTLTYSSKGTSYSGTANFGYFIQNDLRTLSTYGEWYHNTSNGKFYMYFGSVDPISKNVQVATINNLIYNNGFDGSKIDNISFIGSIDDIADLVNGNDYSSIQNCDLLFAGRNAISAPYGKSSQFNYNTISYCNNTGIASEGVSTSITGNKILNIATLVGQSLGASSSTGINITGNGSVVSQNVIRNISWTGINLKYTGAATIEYNLIDSVCTKMDDGGGIYTAYPNTSLRKIDHNIILNVFGTTDGSGTATPMSKGIFLDEESTNVLITNNTIGNCLYTGIFLHNAYNNTITDNVVYNSGQSIFFQNTIAVSNIKNNSLRRNQFFAKKPSQYSLRFQYSANDIINFGIADSNYYLRPIDDDYLISLSQPSTGGVFQNVAGWQSFSGKDLHSKSSPIKIPSFKVNSLIGSNKFGNEAFTSGIAGISASSSPTVHTLEWDNTTKISGSGSLKITSSVSGVGLTKVYFTVGATDKAKKYVLKFKIRGTKPGSYQTYLRQWTGNFAGITSTQIGSFDTNIQQQEILFSGEHSTESNVAVYLNLSQDASSVYIDDIQFSEADATLINFDDYHRFEYNASSSPKVVSFSGLTYADAMGNTYSNSVTIPAWGSKVLILKGSAPVTNQAPTAIAGTDKSITLPLDNVSLTGSGTDKDGTISSYVWSKISGPAAGVIASPAAAASTINGLTIKGVYQFQLTVTDNGGLTDKDTVIVTVNDPVVGSKPPQVAPVAVAGTDKTITLPVTSIGLGGSGTDSDGTISSYAWSKISGPAAGVIASPSAATTVINNLTIKGIYQFQLTVTDNSGLTDKDTLVVTVNDVTGTNQAPVANAGSDKSITLPETSKGVTGSGTDKDGTISSYAWSKISGPAAGVIASPNSATTLINNLTVNGVYQFQLTVTDNNGLTDKDTLVLTVYAAGASQPPSSGIVLHPAVNPANTVNGLDYKYYEGLWSAIPSFSALKPVKSGTTGNLDLSTTTQIYKFGYSFTGLINVPADGEYTFYTTSDDGSNLYIDNLPVVANDGLHASAEKSGKIGLKAGKHYITVNYFQEFGGKVFNVSYQSAAITKQTVPASALYRITAGAGARVATVADNSTALTAGDITGVNNTFKISSFPNPTNTEFSLNVQGGINEKVNILVADGEGRIVYQTTGNANKIYKFGNSFSKGIYIIKVMQGNLVQTIKVIKI
jgi:parallel beta-helix repeat protein